jgi:hypothetical protein
MQALAFITLSSLRVTTFRPELTTTTEASAVARLSTTSWTFSVWMLAQMVIISRTTFVSQPATRTTITRQLLWAVNVFVLLVTQTRLAEFAAKPANHIVSGQGMKPGCTWNVLLTHVLMTLATLVRFRH